MGIEGLYIIDFHAAHERVMYERLKDQTQFSRIGKQELLKPISLELSKSEATAFEQMLPQITDMGLSTSQYDVVVTASVSDYEFKQGGNNANASASIATAIINNWSSAGAGSVFLGHTNPSGFAPAVLGTFTTGSQGTTIIFTGNTGAVEGGEVDDAQPVSGLSVAATHAATGSMTTTTSGNDTFYDDPGQQIFNGLNSPYSSMPRKY